MKFLRLPLINALDKRPKGNQAGMAGTEAGAQVPTVRLQDVSTGRRVEPLVHYQYADDELPTHITSRGNPVYVVDLADPRTVGSVRVLGTGRAQPVAARMEGAGQDSGRGGLSRPEVVIETYFSSSEEARSAAGPNATRGPSREEPASEKKVQNACKGDAKRLPSGMGDRSDCDKKKTSERPKSQPLSAVQVAAITTADSTAFATTPAIARPSLEAQATPARGTSSSVSPLFDEFSSRSDHIRSLLADRTLAELSLDAKGPRLASQIHAPTPSRASRIVSGQDTPGSPRGLEQFKISEYFPPAPVTQQRQSPPVRISAHEVGIHATPPRRASTTSSPASELTADRKWVIAGLDTKTTLNTRTWTPSSPLPRLVSPTPWHSPGATPSDLSAVAAAPVPLGRRMSSRSSTGSADPPISRMDLTEQFDAQLRQCVQNALASVRAQMEDLRARFTREFAQQQLRQQGQNDVFPFARSPRAETRAKAASPDITSMRRDERMPRASVRRPP